MEFSKALSEATNSRNRDTQELVAKYHEYLQNIIEQFNQDKDAVKLSKDTEELQKTFLKRLAKTPTKKAPINFPDEEVDEVTVVESGKKRARSTDAEFEDRPDKSAAQDSSTLTGIVEKGEIKINLAAEHTGKEISAAGRLPYEGKWPTPTVSRVPTFGTLESIMDVASYFGVPNFCIAVLEVLNTWIGDYLPAGQSRAKARVDAQDFYSIIQGRFADLEAAKLRLLEILRRLYDEPKPTKKQGETHDNFRTSHVFTRASDNLKRTISTKK